MILSIAVVTNERSPIAHPGDESKIASELKKRAKALKGSVYVKDQRNRAVESSSWTGRLHHTDTLILKRNLLNAQFKI
jgi:hypothetical protein